MGANIEEELIPLPVDVKRSDKNVQKDNFGEYQAPDFAIPRFIYAQLGNLSDNKRITKTEKTEGSTDFSMYPESTPYQKFMMDMDRFQTYNVDVENIKAIDEYLGNLGMTLDYPFLDDKYNVESWIDIETSSEYRNVITMPFNIDENVITSISGEDYNIIHRT